MSTVVAKVAGRKARRGRISLLVVLALLGTSALTPRTSGSPRSGPVADVSPPTACSSSAGGSAVGSVGDTMTALSGVRATWRTPKTPAYQTTVAPSPGQPTTVAYGGGPPPARSRAPTPPPAIGGAPPAPPALPPPDPRTPDTKPRPTPGRQ